MAEPTPPSRYLTPPTPTPLPGRHQTRPLARLKAEIVAGKIRDHLEGRLSRAALSDWAMGQFVKQDFSQWFEPSQARLLMEAISVLIPVDSADPAGERESLIRLAHRLETASKS